jgi:hypothetical protein
MLVVSTVDDFSEAVRSDRRMPDQPAVAIDSVTFMLLDGGAMATKLRSAVRLCLRRVIVQMGAIHFVRAIESEAFSSSSLRSIVIPRTVEILGFLFQ